MEPQVRTQYRIATRDCGEFRAACARACVGVVYTGNDGAGNSLFSVTYGRDHLLDVQGWRPFKLR